MSQDLQIGSLINFLIGRMKFIRYIAYLLYSYYSTGARRNVAYLSTILAVTFLIYIHLLLIMVLLRVDEHIPIGMGESKGVKYLKIALFMSPIFFLLYFGIKEKKLLELRSELGKEHKKKEIKHRIILFVYLFLAFAVLMAAAIYTKK
jgi:hypothetical protein